MAEWQLKINKQNATARHSALKQGSGARLCWMNAFNYSLTGCVCVCVCSHLPQCVKVSLELALKTLKVSFCSAELN